MPRHSPLKYVAVDENGVPLGFRHPQDIAISARVQEECPSELENAPPLKTQEHQEDANSETKLLEENVARVSSSPVYEDPWENYDEDEEPVAYENYYAPDQTFFYFDHNVQPLTGMCVGDARDSQDVFQGYEEHTEDKYQNYSCRGLYEASTSTNISECPPREETVYQSYISGGVYEAPTNGQTERETATNTGAGTPSRSGEGVSLLFFARNHLQQQENKATPISVRAMQEVLSIWRSCESHIAVYFKLMTNKCTLG